jgi:hypothetical protein
MDVATLYFFRHGVHCARRRGMRRRLEHLKLGW